VTGPAAVELRLRVPATALAGLDELLPELSPEGYLIEDADTLGGADLPAGHARLRLFVPPARVEPSEAALRAALGDVPIGREDVPEQDWNAVWRAHYAAVDIDDRLRVEPAWLRTEEPPGRVHIAIDPGSAFGTGTHETTRLALRALLGALPAGTSTPAGRLLDVGAGSAILGIAAARLGVPVVQCFDNDPVAEENARDNIALNDVADRVAFAVADDPDDYAEAAWDVVIANIISGVLTRLRDGLIRRVRPGGLLVLSGILDHEGATLRAHFEDPGALEFIRQTREGEWLALTYRRRGPKR
jgi:ribosomal protein L11 methyltransferase